MTENKIIFMGCGKMGGALLKAWAAGGLVSKKDFLIIEHNADLVKLYKKQGFDSVTSADKAPKNITSKLIVLAVKPNIIKEALAQSAPFINKQTIILSIAAGKTVKFIESALPFKLPVVRVMPNMCVSEGLGVSGMFANAAAKKAQKDFCFKLMAQTGLSFWVDKETDLHIITAVSGSSPAYIYNAALMLAKTAESYGIKEDLARKIAVNVLLGSALVFANGSGTLQDAIARIATPGGTTEAAIKTFNKNDALLKLYKKAAAACIKRSEELGK